MKSPFTPLLVTLFLCGTALCTACQSSPADEVQEALNTAERFATHYANLRMDEAFEHCTPESRPWLMLRASTLTERDLEVRNAAALEARVEVSDFRRELTNDSCARVQCTVYDVLMADSSERPARMSGKAVCTLPLVKRNGTWLIRLTAPVRMQ